MRSRLSFSRLRPFRQRTRLLEQPTPGKTYALNLGFEASRYEYMIICDDDNWLSRRYIQTAFEVMETNASIGALGGKGTAEFLSDRPAWFSQFAHNYAACGQGTESGDVTHAKGCLFGAGMVTRKSAWQKLQDSGFRQVLTCRKGKSLISGGDTEYSFALRLLGYRLWYDSRLEFRHFMPSERLSWDYLLRMRSAMIKSVVRLLPYRIALDGRRPSRGTVARRLLQQVSRDGLVHLKRFVLPRNPLEREEARSFFQQKSLEVAMLFSFKRDYAGFLDWLDQIGDPNFENRVPG